MDSVKVLFTLILMSLCMTLASQVIIGDYRGTQGIEQILEDYETTDLQNRNIREFEGTTTSEELQGQGSSAINFFKTTGSILMWIGKAHFSLPFITLSQNNIDGLEQFERILIIIITIIHIMLNILILLTIIGMIRGITFRG